MKKIIALLLIVFLAGCSPSVNPGSAGGKAHLAADSPVLDLDQYYELARNQPLSDESVQSLRDFAWKSAAELLSGEANDNYSPLSLYMALAMVSSGAEADTADELYQLLNRSPDKAKLAEDMDLIYQYLNVHTETGKTKLANSIWNEQDFPFESEYIERLTNQYHASLFEVDFGDPKTGQAMSDWVSEATEGLIEPEFNDIEDFVSVLFNTLYFKESWHTPFEPDQTQADTFHSSQGDVDKDFMQTVQEMNYINQSGVEGALLRMERSHMIFLKSPGNSPAEILKQHDMEQLIDSAERAEVTLKLPKFKFDNNYDLIPLLQQLGVEKMIDPDQADLSGMSPETLFISKVIQQSYIGLDETGVEAAAMTMVGMETTAAPMDPPKAELTLDEPFLFIIMSDNGLPLFIGSLAQ